jgi:CRISPR-associated protein Cas5h
MPNQSSNPGTETTPPRCLSFSIEANWGHFREIHGNVVKGSYKIIPRTTLAGLIAAIIGLPRDSYYEYFTNENSQIAIEPTDRLRTMNIAINSLSTDSGGMNKVKGSSIEIKIPDPQALRQQHTYEMLVDPSYRVDIWLNNNELYEELKTHLKNETSVYTPSLGLSEHIASITYHGEFEPTIRNSDGVVEVDSAIPEQTTKIIPISDQSHSIERSPSQMEADETGRVRTASQTIAYNPTSGALTLRDVTTHTVDGRTVMFS